MENHTKRGVVLTFWGKEPREFLERRRVALLGERDRYLETSDDWREVQWYLDILDEVLARK